MRRHKRLLLLGVVSLAVFCIMCITSVFVFFQTANQESLRAVTGTNGEDYKTELAVDMADNLINLDGTLNGQIAATILNDIDQGYFMRPFRIFPTVGEEGTSEWHLSQTYFRITFVHGQGLNRRVAFWAWNAYRNSVYHTSTLTPYSNSLVRQGLVTDFGVIQAEIPLLNTHITTALKTSEGVLVTDRIWLPSLAEVAAGGEWGLTPAQRTGNPNGNNAWSWLRSMPESMANTVTPTGGTAQSMMTSTVVHGVRPAFYFNLGNLENAVAEYDALSRGLFNESGDFNTDIAKLVLSHVNAENRHVPFRLFSSQVGDAHVSALTRSYWRIANVDEYNDKVTVWAVNPYRASHFGSFVGNNNYSASLVRENLLDDFEVILDMMPSLVDDDLILPAGNNTANLVPGDFVWLPSMAEVGSGVGIGEHAVGAWNMTAAHRSFDVGGLTHSVAWLRSSSGSLNANFVDSAGVTGARAVTSPTVATVIRPALHLRLSALEELFEARVHDVNFNLGEGVWTEDYVPTFENHVNGGYLPSNVGIPMRGYGYYFLGFYDSAVGGRRLFLSTGARATSSPVYVERGSNLTLFARWSEYTQYTVTFWLEEIGDGGGKVLKQVQVTSGRTVQEPNADSEEFVREGYEFSHWTAVSIADSSNRVAFNFGTPVTNDLNLFAVFSPDSGCVGDDCNGNGYENGSAVDVVLILGYVIFGVAGLILLLALGIIVAGKMAEKRKKEHRQIREDVLRDLIQGEIKKRNQKSRKGK